MDDITMEFEKLTTGNAENGPILKINSALSVEEFSRRVDELIGNEMHRLIIKQKYAETLQKLMDSIEEKCRDQVQAVRSGWLFLSQIEESKNSAEGGNN